MIRFVIFIFATLFVTVTGAEQAAHAAEKTVTPADSAAAGDATKSAPSLPGPGNPTGNKKNPFRQEPRQPAGDPSQQLDLRVKTLENVNLTQLKSLVEGLQRRMTELEDENHKLRRDLDEVRNKLNLRIYRY
jgi:hypothetical protein